MFWRQGRSLPYGEGVAFWALGEMVKAQGGILETDSPDDAAAKLSSAVETVIGTGEASWVERHLRPLVGLCRREPTPTGRRRRSQPGGGFSRRLPSSARSCSCSRISTGRKTRLLDFVDELVEWASDVPLLVVASTRPELLTRRPDWGGGKPNAATVGVARSRTRTLRSLVHALLERAVLPAEVQRGCSSMRAEIRCTPRSSSAR